MIELIYIIGSGPAGIAAASALLARGRKVTMLDVGVELDKEIQLKLAQFRNQPNFDLLKELKYELSKNNDVKLAYGSDYVYRQNQLVNFVTDGQIYCQPSFAKGGLSNIWGAFVDTYHPNDFHDWPFTIEKLWPYYQKILEFLPIATNQIHEKEKYSFHYKPSDQAKYLLDHYLSSGNKLSNSGFQYGPAKLAVRFADIKNQHCSYCGMCQYGCPSLLIYSSTDSLNKLLKNENFIYKDRVFVEKIEEKSDGIILHILKGHVKEKDSIPGSQVFIACGSILSTTLVLNSLGQHQEPAVLADSQHFMFPCILFKKINKPQQENLHTLCQLYLKLKNDHFLSQDAHLQIYTYMDQYQKKLQRKFGRLFPFIKLLLSPLLSRLIVIQGFLHSQDSNQFSLQVVASGLEISEITVKLAKIENVTTQAKINRVISHLTKHSRLLKFFPIKSMLKVSKVGRSYHYGGSFPMSAKPTTHYQTDLLGRVNGFKRLHIVDGAIFPSIPANSITFTIMANAYRIATECPIL